MSEGGATARFSAEGFPIAEKPRYAISIHEPDGEIVVAVRYDGKVDVNPKYTWDEASARFWDAITRYSRPFGIWDWLTPREELELLRRRQVGTFADSVIRQKP